MASEHFKLAVLNALARSADGRASLDELRREIPILLANEDETEQLQRFSALGDIDIFQSGLLLRNKVGFEITDAGLALLQSLESSDGASLVVSSIPPSPALKFIDDLIGTEERLRIFDLELRPPENDGGEGIDDQSEQEDQTTSDDSNLDLTENIENIDSPVIAEADEADQNPPFEDQALTSDVTPPQEAPAYLRRSFGSKVEDTRQMSFLALITTTKQLIRRMRRRPFAASLPHGKTERPVGGVGGAAFALLSLLVVITCLGAAIALGQIKSLKSEIALLQRELLPLRERLAKLEQVERSAEQQQEAKNKSRAAGEVHTDQAALNLSREDIQLIREYIKPAPSPAIAAPEINVGDPVGSATIPVPSALMEKIPKLAGARFTTRNGAIIIVKKDSRQADAVLGPQ